MPTNDDLDALFPSMQTQPPSRREKDTLMTHRADGAVDVITVNGDLDSHQAARLRALAIDLDARGRRQLVLDLTGCTYLGAAGLGVIVGVRQRFAPAGGEVAIACTREPILRAFEVAELRRLFPICDSARLALAALSRQLPAEIP
jgi:anti-anti-sigma factor